MYFLACEGTSKDGVVVNKNYFYLFKQVKIFASTKYN